MGAAKSKKRPKKPSAFLRLVEILANQYENRDATIIVILGAGASYCSGMPPWVDLKKKILMTAKNCYDVPDDFIEDTWQRISAITGIESPSQRKEDLEKELLKSASVELICNVACESRVVAKKIQELFIEKYGFDDPKIGPRPQLCYELLAHFLKHKFIDHLITFNFDEILDKALDNELGPDEYDRILSDQQIFQQQKLVKPRLIKLHGSISAPQTLRFKRDNTGDLPQELINLLDDTLSHSHLGQSSSKVKKKIHIISLGYSWRDWDFAVWVKSRIKNISSITIVQKENRVSEQIKNLRKSKTEINVISTKNLSVPSDDKDSAGVISIDQLLWALWNELEKKFKKKRLIYIPVSRHLILGHLFGPRIESPGFLPKEFLINHDFLHTHVPKRRFTAEIFLHLFKCKGMVNASVMAFDPRLHHYYIVYKDYKKPKNPLDDIRDLIQSPYADVKETYFTDAKTVSQLMERFIDHDQFSHKTTVFRPSYTEQKDGEKIRLIATSHDKFMQNHLEEIYNGPEVEIVPKLDVRAEWLFNSPKPLANYLATQKLTSNLMKTDWSHLFVIAETGAWLFQGKIFECLKKLKKIDSKKRRTIFLIRTSSEGAQRWRLRKEIVKGLSEQEKILKESIYITKVELPWWEHNRHLTLAYSEDQKKFLGGIYFRRRLKTSRISPISVDDDQDCKELYFTFMSYFSRVQETKPNRFHRGFRSRLFKIDHKMEFDKNFKKRRENIIKKIMNSS